MLSQIERAHPISLLVTPANHNALIAFANGLRANPAPIGTLQARILQAIPDLARLYAQDPTLPPLFHVQQLTQAIRQRQQQQGANVQLLIYKLNLACLPWSPPKNRHPLDPNAPGGPTVDFVLAFREVLRRRAPHLTLWVQVSGVCCREDDELTPFRLCAALYCTGHVSRLCHASATSSCRPSRQR